MSAAAAAAAEPPAAMPTPLELTLVVAATRTMGIGPVPASQLALKKAGLTLDQIDLIEFNEAFAAQTLACVRGLGLEGSDPRINPNGGAIALGHPLGCSGAKLTVSAVHELRRRGGGLGLITMCVGGGQGYLAGVVCGFVYHSVDACVLAAAWREGQGERTGAPT